MKITITSTDKMTTVDGVPVRVWEGVTEQGVPCTVLVHRIAVKSDQDCTVFEGELLEKLPPCQFYPLRMILP